MARLAYVLFSYPLAGLAWLTLVLATFLLIEAVLEFVLYFNIRRRVNASWVLFDAIITLLLWTPIWACWLFSSGVGVWDARRREPDFQRHLASDAVVGRFARACHSLKHRASTIN